MLPPPETGRALLGRIRILPGGTKGTVAHALLNQKIQKLETALAS
jgi:hypothetical protein